MRKVALWLVALSVGGSAIGFLPAPAHAAGTAIGIACNVNTNPSDVGFVIRFSCTWDGPYELGSLAFGFGYDDDGTHVPYAESGLFQYIVMDGTGLTVGAGMIEGHVGVSGPGYLAGYAAVNKAPLVRGYDSFTEVPGAVLDAAELSPGSVLMREGPGSWSGVSPREAFTATFDEPNGEYPNFPPTGDGHEDPPGGGNPNGGGACVLVDVTVPGAGEHREEGEEAVFTVTFTGEVFNIRVEPDVLWNDGNDSVTVDGPLTSPVGVTVTFPHSGTPASAIQVRCGNGTYQTATIGNIPGNGSSGGGGIPPSVSNRPAIGSCFGDAGFGINPADWGPALVKAGSCVSQALFVPETVDDEWNRLQDAADGTAIEGVGGVVTDVFGAPLSFIDEAEDGGDCHGPAMDLTPLAESAGVAHPLDACDGPGATMAGFMKLVLGLGLVLGGAIACGNMILGAFGMQKLRGSKSESGGDVV